MSTRQIALAMSPPILMFRFPDLLPLSLVSSKSFKDYIKVTFNAAAAMRRYEEQIRVLQEDLESEMQLRRRVEHEKQQFQMQIISLSERLTEAESGSESQLEINRKREAEMAKLRKLLEDVHNESEQQIHTLRTKHQTSMMELQEQIERMSREKEKVVKEKSVMKTEISELYAQIEILQSEKISIKKVRKV